MSKEANTTSAKETLSKPGVRVTKARAESSVTPSLITTSPIEPGARPRAMTEVPADMMDMMPMAAYTPTTVMLRNIPNQYSAGMLCKKLDLKGFAGQYDFLYLPIDRS